MQDNSNRDKTPFSSANFSPAFSQKSTSSSPATNAPLVCENRHTGSQFCNTGAKNGNFSGLTIALAGGGTGGHIYPNLALVPQLKRRGFDLAYLGGDKGAPEREIALNAGLKYYGVQTIKLIRSLSPSAIKNNLSIPKTLRQSINAAKDILLEVKPAALFSKGGYASLPFALAAIKLGIPTFAHESDLTLGAANKIAVLKGATALKANPLSSFDGIFVGMPLREQLFCRDKRVAMQKLGIKDNGKPIALIMGGSSGASFLNDRVFEALPQLLKRYNVLHITGKNKATQNLPSLGGDAGYYLQFEYCDNVWDVYAASDVVISRAGATAVYELSALKKRALFVPLPKGISRGDQLYNAKLAEKYGGKILLQDGAFKDKFIPSIEKTLADSPMTAITVDANGKIVDLICDSIRRGVS